MCLGHYHYAPTFLLQPAYVQTTDSRRQIQAKKLSSIFLFDKIHNGGGGERGSLQWKAHVPLFFLHVISSEETNIKDDKI